MPVLGRIIAVKPIGGGTKRANLLTVEVESGAVVTATNGTETVSATSSDGVVNLELTEAGTYTITATVDGRVAENTIEIVNEYSSSFDFGLRLSSLPVGTLVRANENESTANFLIVHQGLPGGLYDESCDGCWLLRNDIYEKRKWGDNNDYGNSAVQAWLNADYLAMLDSSVQAAIKQVKIPYRRGTGKGGTTVTGADGLSAKVFLLSGYEVNWTTAVDSYLPILGSTLSYFSGTSVTGNDSKRIANYNGTASHWWTRDPFTYGTSQSWYVTNKGGNNTYSSTGNYGVRPAFVLPSNARVLSAPNEDGSYTLIP